MSVNKDNNDELLELIKAKDTVQNLRFDNKTIMLLADYINASVFINRAIWYN